MKKTIINKKKTTYKNKYNKKLSTLTKTKKKNKQWWCLWRTIKQIWRQAKKSIHREHRRHSKSSRNK